MGWVAALDAMSPGRMVAGLAAALAVGAIVASLGSGAPGGFAALAVVVALAAAIVIAALIVLPFVVIGALRSGRPAPPRGRVLVVALAIGGLVVFPVSSSFYMDAGRAAEGSRVGHCEGVLPLAQAAQLRVADDPYAPVSYFAGCLD